MKDFFKYFYCVFCFIGLFFISNFAYSEINIDIKITQPEHHLLDIKLVVPKSDKNELQFYLPVWRPGRYQILTLANAVRLFAVKNSQGDALSWQKLNNTTWQINHTAGQELVISYQVYANQLAYRTRHVDDSHAFLNASSLILYSEETRAEKHIVNLTTPAGWQSFSGLVSGNTPNQFIADDYDQLVDSPIETGDLIHHSFTQDDVFYDLVIWGKGNYNDVKIKEDLQKLVAAAQDYWFDYPFKRYLFMLHATSDASGATEHANSTIIQKPRYKFSDRKDYIDFLKTAAHEFIHAWNVKYYRPEGLVPYQYQQENYSNLLWLVEGSTSYFQAQLLLRAKLITVKEYLAELANIIDNANKKPGIKAQSVAQSSFNKWLEEGNDFDKNNSANIYSEGLLASWLLDVKLLDESEGALGYRDVHKRLAKNFALPKTFNDRDVKNILKELSGNSYETWWQNNIDSPLQLDFSALLNKAGLQMVYGKDNSQKAWLGLTTEIHRNGLLVKHVTKDSPAWQAGLTTDDVIIALDGLRVADNDLKARLLNFVPGQTITINYFRRDQLQQTSVLLGQEPKDKLEIKPVAKSSSAQKRFFKAWLGVDFTTP